MSKSKRKIPIIGITTCKSEKKDKRIYNRKLRHKVKVACYLALTEEDLQELFLTKKNVSDPWNMGKDGKSYFGNNKNKSWYKKAMRK